MKDDNLKSKGRGQSGHTPLIINQQTDVSPYPLMGKMMFYRCSLR